MSRETSRARARRIDEGLYETVFVGTGIDIGCGDDQILPSCIPWDIDQGDAHDLAGIDNESLDYVYSSHCLEHLADPRRALLRWWEVLRPGGRMLFIVPDEDLYEQGTWPSRYNSDHKVTFTPHKSASWSPVSRNLCELVAMLPDHKLIYIKTCDAGYHYSDEVWDRTQGDAEASIEVLVEKCRAASRQGRAYLRAQRAPKIDNVTKSDLSNIGGQGVFTGPLSVLWTAGRAYTHSISAHAPSNTAIELAGRHASFTCLVGFTDEASHLILRADFCVKGDGRVLAIARDVASECEPVLLRANVRGIQGLELIVSSREAENCSTAWFDPQLDTDGFYHETTTILDCLDRVEIVIPSPRIRAERCIATVV
jgi:predicted SAM-dependent methyltransferase